jgi:hypothetical protein
LTENGIGTRPFEAALGDHNAQLYWLLISRLAMAAALLAIVG